jgi:hypothetical protein
MALTRVLDRRPSAPGDLTVVIDGLPTTDYPHSRFRNPASSIKQFVLADSQSRTPGQWLALPSHASDSPSLSLFPESKVFPESEAETLGAVPKLVVNLSLGPRQPCPRMFEQANFNKSQWLPIKRFTVYQMDIRAPKNRSSVPSERFL